MSLAKKNIPPRSSRNQGARLRSLLAALLVLSLFLHPQAWNSWTLLLRAKIRLEVRKMQRQPEAFASTLIKIPVKWLEEGHPQLVWTEEDEFRYFGEMYDILSQELHKDTIWYHCYHDKAETELLNGLFEKLQAQDEALPVKGLQHSIGTFFEKWQLSDQVFKSFAFAQLRVLNEGSQSLSGRAADTPPLPPPEGTHRLLFL